MARTTNTRIAGFTLLLYIAVGVIQMVVFSGTTTGEDTAAKYVPSEGLGATLFVNLL